YLASIGSTNSVQPYCRLAIIAMQTMPIASCIQRKPLDVISDGEAACVLETIYFPPNRAISGCDLLSQGRDLSSQALSENSGILYSNMQARHCGPRST